MRVRRAVKVSIVVMATALAAAACSSTSTTAAGSTSAAPTTAAATGTTSGSPSAPSPAGGGSAVSTAPSSTAASQERLDGVTLTMWVGAGAATAQAAAQPIGAFEKATGAKINIVVVPGAYETTLPTKLATGAKPDLMYWQPTESALASIRGTDILQPLTNEAWASSYAPAASSLGVVNGQRYAAIVSAPSSIGIYYNKQAFAKAGIKGIPKGFAGLMSTAATIKASGTVPFYEVGKDNWPLQWIPSMLLAELTKTGSFWPAVNNNSGRTWSDPAIVSAFQSYKSIFDDGYAQPDYKNGTFNDQADALFDGKVAMAAQLGALTALMQTKHTAAEIDQRIGFFPLSKDGNIGTYVADQSNAVVAPKTGDAKREAATRAFLAFWLGPDYPAYVTALKYVSIEKSVPSPAGVPKVAQSNFDSLANSVGAFQMVSSVSPNITVYLQDMLYGKKSPQDVADACWAEFQKVAAAQGLPGF